jgi:hypothetical protein
MIFGALRQAASGGIKGLAASAAARGGGVSGWARTGFSGLAKGGFIGFGMYVEAMSTGREYGMGAGLARGAAYSVPYVGIAMMAYDIGRWLEMQPTTISRLSVVLHLPEDSRIHLEQQQPCANARNTT